MFRYESIREADVAALLKLVGEVTELPVDKVVRRTHVLHALLELEQPARVQPREGQDNAGARAVTRLVRDAVERRKAVLDEEIAAIPAAQ